MSLFDPLLFDDDIFDIAGVPPFPPPSPPPLGVRFPSRRVQLVEFREHLYFEAHIIKRFIDQVFSTAHVAKKFIEKMGFDGWIIKPIRETVTVEALVMTDELAKSLCEMFEKVEKALKENS